MAVTEYKPDVVGSFAGGRVLQEVARVIARGIATSNDRSEWIDLSGVLSIQVIQDNAVTTNFAGSVRLYIINQHLKPIDGGSNATGFRTIQVNNRDQWTVCPITSEATSAIHGAWGQFRVGTRTAGRVNVDVSILRLDYD